MRRTVYFTGELKDKFGDSIVLDSDDLKDITKGIDANRPGFILNLHSLLERGLDLRVYNAGKYIDPEKDGPLFPLAKGDLILSVAPQGEGGMKEILAGILLVILAFALPGPVASTWGSSALLTIGLNLTMMGVQELLAPEIGEEEDPEDTYIFSGPKNSFSSGQAVPIVYGEVRLGGLVINVQQVSQKFTGVDMSIDDRNNIYAGIA